MLATLSTIVVYFIDAHIPQCMCHSAQAWWWYHARFAGIAYYVASRGNHGENGAFELAWRDVFLRQMLLSIRRVYGCCYRGRWQSVQTQIDRVSMSFGINKMKLAKAV